MHDEGVIKFAAVHRTTPALAVDIDALAAWRTKLFEHGVIGADPARYGGAGFGNVSQRMGPYPGVRGARPFVISGTQTGGLPSLQAAHWVVVTAYDVSVNQVISYGPMLPSSEAMTHGAIYDLSADIRVVLHVHAPRLWQAALRLALPCTAADVGYGTPAMAQQVLKLWTTTRLRELRVLAMLGHEDGVIAFGENADEAGGALLSYLTQQHI